MPSGPEDRVRAAAIDRIRRETREQPANTALRLQLGDLLLEAGRPGEAVPVFLGLADHFASRGLLARAAAALRRIEAIDPGREDVTKRRQALEQRTTAALFTDVVPGRRTGAPDDDTRPKVLLPGETTGDAFPARRKHGEPDEDEQFLSMPEDAVQDQLEGLIEDLYLPPDAPAAAAPEAPSEGGLPGLLFSELPPAERRAVLHGLKLRAYEPGDILVTEGESPKGLTLVTAGGLLLHARDADGRNRVVGAVEEGDFFGEIASLPGLPRDVTVVATAPGEMLELDQDAVDRIALDQPRVWARMHAVARDRAAARAANRSSEEEAPGQSAAEPRMRLGMVKAFLRAGQQEEARRMLLDLADDLVRRGQSERAITLLKRAEKIRPVSGAARRGPSPSPAGRKKPATHDRLASWASTLARSAKAPLASAPPRLWAESLADPETLHAQAGLRACRLFDGMGDEDLLGFVQKLPLESRGPGEILLTEGEPSDSVLVITRGRVKVFVRQRSGRDGLLRELREGAFLGEIGALSGTPRTATATTATRCVLLRVDRKALKQLCRAHPKARAVLEETLADRASNPAETPVRERSRNED